MPGKRVEKKNPPEKAKKKACGGKPREPEPPGKRPGKRNPPEKAKKKACGELVKCIQGREEMKILVVGGTRFFGIPMVEKLLADGHDVTIATRGNAVNPFADRTKQILMDRTDPESVKAALSGRSYDVVIDKIAYSSNDVKALLPNVSCRKYIQMSTCSVYGTDHEGIREEEFVPREYPLEWMDRNENYGEGKRQAERGALEFLGADQCVFVRYPVVMGEHDYTGRLKFYVEHVVQGRPMYIDDPDDKMAFIHEKEAGMFIAHLVDQQVSGAVNGASFSMISPREIISYIERKVGRKAVFDDHGDIAPYNGATANISYDTSIARGCGFTFSKVEDWIYKLLDHEIIGNP